MTVLATVVSEADKVGVDRTDLELHQRVCAWLAEPSLLERLDRTLMRGGTPVLVGLETLHEFAPSVARATIRRARHILGVDRRLHDLVAGTQEPDGLAAIAALDRPYLVSLDWQVGGFKATATGRALSETGCGAGLDVIEPVLEHLHSRVVEATRSLIEPWRTEVRAAVTKISIVMISGLDNRPILEGALRSLDRTVSPADDVEIIFVCNGSQDGSDAAALSLLSPRHRLTIVRVPENLGIAGGFNAGVACARGEHVVFVQDDVGFTRRDWHRELSSCFDRHPRIGVLGADRGAYYYRLPDARPWEVPYASVAVDDVELRRTHLVEVDSANWIVVAMRRELAHLDECYLPNGIEDHAANYAARRRGFEIWITDVGIEHDLHRPQASVTRRLSWTAGRVHRLSRWAHYDAFMRDFGDLLRPWPQQGLPTFSAIREGVRTMPRSAAAVTATQMPRAGLRSALPRPLAAYR